MRAPVGGVWWEQEARGRKPGRDGWSVVFDFYETEWIIKKLYVHCYSIYVITTNSEAGVDYQARLL